MIERFALDPTKKGRSYSKGNRQKVALVAALAADVELLLLDEPTSGLDPLMEAVFKDAVRDFRAQGGTVLLSSHILSEVESVCDRVSIIRDGRNVESGTLAELRHLSHTTIDATLERPAVQAEISALPGVTGAVVSGTHVTCVVESGHLGAVLQHLGTHGITQPDERPADARGALHGAVPRAGGDAMTAPTALSAPRGRERPAAGSGLTGTARLLRLAARRDRVLIPVSAFTLAAVVAGSAQATFDLYPDRSSAGARCARRSTTRRSSRSTVRSPVPPSTPSRRSRPC